MADFFGGILEDLRGYVKDADSFFDTTIGRAVATGAKAGYGWNQSLNNGKGGYASEETSSDSGPNYMGIRSPDGGLNQGSTIESEDFSVAELRWLQRMKSFANLDTGTDVKLGK